MRPACYAHDSAGLGVDCFEPFDAWLGEGGEDAFCETLDANGVRGPEGDGLHAVEEG